MTPQTPDPDPEQPQAIQGGAGGDDGQSGRPEDQYLVAVQGQQHEHDGREWRQQTGREEGDAGLVAEDGEAVETGQAHHAPPRSAVGLGRRLLGGGRTVLDGQAFRHPRAQSGGGPDGKRPRRGPEAG
ncbi:hypothetical protein GCM10010493_84520 [Streptomyces lavendulae subsp. grasserius]